MPVPSPHGRLLRLATVPKVLCLGLAALPSAPSRRNFVWSALSAPWLYSPCGAGALPTAGHEEAMTPISAMLRGVNYDVDEAAANPELLGRCRDGALAVEQAVPGAYQHECMALQVRRVPVRLPAPAAAPMNSASVALLEIEQRPAVAGTTGTAIWNGDLLLTRLLERLSAVQPNWLRDRTVLELGCGAGLVGLAAAVLGAGCVLATDGNPAVVDLALHNAARNGLNGTVSAQRLQWGFMGAMELAEKADIVLGADLTYSPGSWRSLAETMEIVVADNGFIIYLSLGHAGFSVGAEVDGFLSVAQQQGMEIIDPTSIDWPFPTIKRPLSTVTLEGIASLEAQIIQEAGGVEVMVLRKKSSRRL